MARRPETLEAARQTVGTTARGRILAVACDVSRIEDIARPHGEVMDGPRRLDILARNAQAPRGRGEPPPPFPMRCGRPIFT